ncbi:MAG: EF-hand domain-containing protein [Pseudomonadota bacterium]
MKKHLTLAAAALVFASTAGAQESGLTDIDLAALDKDGDLAVSSEEFGNFAEYAFKQMDTNQNGSLTPNEVAAHAPAGAFQRTDSDGNGVVSKSEYDTRMKSIFDEADKDGDGQLN